MSPRYIVTLGELAVDTLPLAEKSAVTYRDWFRINQTAAELLRALQVVYLDETIVASLRTHAEQCSAPLGIILRRSSAECDGFRASGEVLPV